MAPADLIVAVILGLATLRGFFLGLSREASSIASLVAACLAVRFGSAPLGVWLEQQAEGSLTPVLAQVAAGALLAICVLIAGTLIGRVLRTGARAVGLAWLDRASGGVLGAAEGALVVAVLLAVVAAVAGRTHPFLAESRTFAVLEEVEAVALGVPEPPSVAAPPPPEHSL